MNKVPAVLVDKIVEEVSLLFEYSSDKKVFNKIEHWSRLKDIDGKLYGDCDDFALEVLYRLKQEGYTAHLAYPAVCSIYGEYRDHCVAVIDSDEGILVADCNYIYPKWIQDLDYTMWGRPSDYKNWKKDWVGFDVRT